MKKIFSSLLTVIFTFSNVVMIFAVETNNRSDPWTREKAEKLASATLFYASPSIVDGLYNAGSASAAVDILFPSPTGPDRSQFDAFIASYTSSGFNWGDSSHMTRLYHLTYALDPYEAKQKLFSLYEDIFSVNANGDMEISYMDVRDLHNLLYENMFGNYEVLVKRVLYNNGGRGDYAASRFLDLLNQQNPKEPNQNYARELLQLFLMGEYEPFRSKDAGDIRNYEETDVQALSKILTGLRSDKLSHAISFDINTHYAGVALPFLTGSYDGVNPPYYNAASGTIDPLLILNPVNGNNGLTDNIVEYIFAKRKRQIALFLADRLAGFYMHDAPSRAELDSIADIIESNNFEMFSTVKMILISDAMYSDTSMNSIRFKNPLELSIGTIKFLRNNNFSSIAIDPNIMDANLLRRLGWTPYFPGSIFGRDGFDNSLKWSSTSVQSTWMTATNYFSYRISGTGSLDLLSSLPVSYRRELTTEIVPIFTHQVTSYSGSMRVISGSLVLESDSGTSFQRASAFSVSAFSFGDDATAEVPILQQIQENGYFQDPVVAIEGGENLIFIKNEFSLMDPPVIDPSGDIPLSFEMPEISRSALILSFSSEETGTGVSLTGSEITLSSGTVMFPNFQISTDMGMITLSGSEYDAGTRTLTITSGYFSSGASGSQIISGTIVFSPDSILITDTLGAPDVVKNYEEYLFGSTRFSDETRAFMEGFIGYDSSGNALPIALSNPLYFNKYIRGLFSIMLSQPEYVLLSGYDLPADIITDETTFLDEKTSKLFIIELYGGNDYLTSLIPKDEYSTYVDYRTNATGSIAISGTGLVDIGDYYMNGALAYSTGTTGFKDLYDQGYLKFFNRVGGYRHSNDHDQAAKQISSYDSTTLATADGVFGHLIKNERESSNTISLGAKLPNVFRSGHFINLGGNVVLMNPLDSGSKYKEHMLALQNFLPNREYPGGTKNLFLDTAKISEIGRTSVAQGGAPGASGNMPSVFSFAKILLNNNIGRTYYMGGAGGYDTHGSQFGTLNTNLKTLSAAVTQFFQEVKDTQDVTILIFSEFGRTNRTNGDLGTDHGDAGGMYMITSNPTLKSVLPNGTYGNMSIKNAKANALGVGIDYRSVYGTIFQSLYGLDPNEYFGTGVSLSQDTSLERNKISLFSTSYQLSGQNIIRNIELSVSGRNYNPGKAGYTRIVTHTGQTSSPRITKLNEKGSGEAGYLYTFPLNPITQTNYSIESFSNQYVPNVLSGSLTGSNIPLIIPNTSRTISQEKNSILALFSNTPTPSVLNGTGIIIESTGSRIVSLPFSPDIRVHFQSGMTRVTDLVILHELRLGDDDLYLENESTRILFSLHQHGYFQKIVRYTIKIS